MTKRLPLSRPRPQCGPGEPPVSFATRLLVWYVEQFHRGWQLSELPALSVDDLRCLHECRRLLSRLGVYRWLEDEIAAGHLNLGEEGGVS